MKNLLYALVFLTSAIRLVSVVILFARGFTALPSAVLAATSFTVLHGMFLLVRRVIFTLHLRHFAQFFAVQSAVFAFNIAVVSSTVLLALNSAERLVVGSLLDILVGAAVIYYCVKSIRKSKYAGASRPM